MFPRLLKVGIITFECPCTRDKFNMGRDYDMPYFVFFARSTERCDVAISYRSFLFFCKVHFDFPGNNYLSY